MSSLVTCPDVKERLAAYLAGALPDAQALGIEAHASECAECEMLLLDASRVPTHTFAPRLPAELRAPTLAAVAARAGAVQSPPVNAPAAPVVMSSRRRGYARWMAAASTLAAAAMLFLVARGPVARRVPQVDSTLAVAPTVRQAEDLADVRARPEFAELERAARELEAELARSPGDAELQGFLEAVNTRRMELERRVKDARS